MKYLFLLITQFLILGSTYSQEVKVAGLVIDNQNNRKLNNAEITVTSEKGTQPIIVNTDNFGKYEVTLTTGQKYTFSVERVAFETSNTTLTLKANDVNLVNNDIKLQRLPGYEFQADVKELLSGGNGAGRKLGDELKNLKIEIYNNTAGREIRVTEDDPKNTFEANFERGNHYTILIRKKGFFAKRIEVNVDIYGCILCFEGLGNNYAPEIEAATDGDDRGLLIADIPMKRIVRNEAIRLENIYYDYNKSDIRPDARPALNKLVQTLRSNPIIIELGSHTDSRGKDDYNQTLSDKRAISAVDYILSRGVKATRISSKGYGENIPLNRCTDDVKCTESEYQFNRRTEFKVTGFLELTNFDRKSLKEILESEKISKKRMKEQIEGI